MVKVLAARLRSPAASTSIHPSAPYASLIGVSMRNYPLCRTVLLFPFGASKSMVGDLLTLLDQTPTEIERQLFEVK